MSALSVIATWLLRYDKGNELAAGRELIRQLDAAGHEIVPKEKEPDTAAGTGKQAS